MRRMLSRWSSLPEMTSWWAAAAERRRGSEPGNTLAAFEPDPANVLAGFDSVRSVKSLSGGLSVVPEPGNTLAGFERRSRSYRETVSRRTPVSPSIRRYDQPSSSRAITCCRFFIFR